MGTPQDVSFTKAGGFIFPSTQEPMGLLINGLPSECQSSKGHKPWIEGGGLDGRDGSANTAVTNGAEGIFAFLSLLHPKLGPPAFLSSLT